MQFHLIIEATTNNGAELTQFQVYEGNTELPLDGKNTEKTFNFGETILIRVTKDGYTEANTTHTITHGDNKIVAYLPIKMVY